MGLVAQSCAEFNRAEWAKSVFDEAQTRAPIVRSDLIDCLNELCRKMFKIQDFIDVREESSQLARTQKSVFRGRKGKWESLYWSNIRFDNIIHRHRKRPHKCIL